MTPEQFARAQGLECVLRRMADVATGSVRDEYLADAALVRDLLAESDQARVYPPAMDPSGFNNAKVDALIAEALEAASKPWVPLNRDRAVFLAGMRAAASIRVKPAHTYASENAGQYVAFDAGAEHHRALILAAIDQLGGGR